MVVNGSLIFSGGLTLDSPDRDVTVVFILDTVLVLRSSSSPSRGPITLTPSPLSNGTVVLGRHPLYTVGPCGLGSVSGLLGHPRYLPTGSFGDLLCLNPGSFLVEYLGWGHTRRYRDPSFYGLTKRVIFNK